MFNVAYLVLLVLKGGNAYYKWWKYYKTTVMILLHTSLFYGYETSNVLYLCTAAFSKLFLKLQNPLQKKKKKQKKNKSPSVFVFRILRKEITDLHLFFSVSLFVTSAPSYPAPRLLSALHFIGYNLSVVIYICCLQAGQRCCWSCKVQNSACACVRLHTFALETCSNQLYVPS